MAQLFSQYASGVQFPAGPTVGSTLGVSGVNAIVDRLNSITTDDGAYSNLAAGEGIDINNGSVIAGENASTSNKGIASFNSTDFSVSTGAVSLKSKTSYLSIPGIAFQSQNETAAYSRSPSQGVLDLNASQNPSAPVMLPHNATVTAVVVFASDSSETWTLARNGVSNSTGATVMASANMNSTDSSISNATIVNNTFKYWLFTSALDASDQIRGATITYTTDYD